jgi:hypothetical protein
MEYNSSEQKDIRSVFNELNEQQVSYVVPRGHQGLPESTQGGDIDVIIEETDFATAVGICEDLGFSTKYNLMGNILNLIGDGIRNPKSVISLLVRSPQELLCYLHSAVTPGQPVSSVNSNFDDQRRYKDDIMFHFLNHVAYKSPLNNAMVRVDPQVEQSMFNNRVIVDGISIPSPVDELVHLICRGVFDYDGDFPPRYTNRCKQLQNNVLTNGTEKFKKLLELLFFDASDVVFKNVKNNSYNQIKADLIKYSEY